MTNKPPNTQILTQKNMNTCLNLPTFGFYSKPPKMTEQRTDFGKDKPTDV